MFSGSVDLPQLTPIKVSAMQAQAQLLTGVNGNNPRSIVRFVETLGPPQPLVLCTTGARRGKTAYSI